jgi:methyl-accepting chemotaxis protein
MTLIKKSQIGKTSLASHRLDGAISTPSSSSANSALAEAQKRKARTFARQQKAAERIAAATAQLASGISEASAAAEEMRKASDQIAAGAEEAASAAQQSLKAVNKGSDLILKTKENADSSVIKIEALQKMTADVSHQISNSLAAINRASQRQESSVGMVEELERQAATISEVVKAVARIADQTNLLALNAAIEAARAGQHGKGFAVVADEVRTLAETSEKSAREIQDLIVQIQREVKLIAEGIQMSAVSARDEVDKGRKTTELLEQISGQMTDVINGGRDIARAAEESSAAAREAQKGSEVIAAAAEEQSAACEEARKTVDQQTDALEQCEQAAQELSELADELKNSSDVAKSSEEVASAAEELSSAVEEINRAATQITVALDQIGQGAQQQSAATQQSSAAISQIEKGAQLSQSLSQAALEKGQAIGEMFAANRAAVDELIAGVEKSVAAGRQSREQITGLEQISRRIDKIVDSITTVSIQTNMLAVNGSVEAARAGEFGKGFAVVSTDIRNLARDSAENADRIKDTVKAIQDQIVIVRGDLTEIADNAVVEVEKNRQISVSLVAVAQEMADLLAGNREVLESCDKIVGVVLEVQTGVEQIAAAAQQASRSAAEATLAAKEQAKGTQELAAAVEEIASLADELQTGS